MGATVSTKIDNAPRETSSFKNDSALAPGPKNITLEGHNLAAMPVQMLATLKLHAPPPYPPLKGRQEVYSPSLYADVDKRVAAMPVEKIDATLYELATYLSSMVAPIDDVGQLRAMFTWLASLNLTDVVQAAGSKGEEQPDSTVISYLIKIHHRKGNYAHMMAAMCNCAGIPVRIITGVSKSSAYRVGTKIDRGSAAAQWNAVHVGGEWRLLDCLWASTCVPDGSGSGDDWDLLDINGERIKPKTTATKTESQSVTHRINEFFFLTNPAELAATHYPNESAWQLTHAPLSWSDFEDALYVRERFFELGAEVTKPELKKCVIHADANGTVIIEMSVDVDSPSVTYKYVLSRSKTGTEETPLDLRKCVFFERKDNLIRYTAHFPTRGAFKFDVYGRDSRTHSSHDLMCSYLVVSEQQSEHFAPLPDEPLIGWGPGASSDAFGLTAVSHRDGRIEIGDSEVEIVFALQYALELRHVLVSGSAATKKGEGKLTCHPTYAAMSVHDGVLTVTLRIPSPGIYALKIFASEECIPGELQNVCNYLVTCRVGSLSQVFPALENGYLGTTSYCKELAVEPVARRHPVVITSDKFVDVIFACDTTVELMAALSTAQGELVGAERCTRTLTCEGCYNFRIDVQEFEILARFYASYLNDPQRLYNVYNCLIRSPKSLTRAAGNPLAEGGRANGLVVADEVVSRVTVAAIPLPRGCRNPGIQLSKKNSYVSPALRQVALEEPSSGSNMLRLRLREQGEYHVELYEKDPRGYLDIYRRYKVFREGDGRDDDVALNDEYKTEDLPEEASSDFIADEDVASIAMAGDAAKVIDADKKRTARLTLRREMDAGILSNIQNAIANYVSFGAAASDDLLKAARRLTLLLQAEEALRKAIQGSSLKNLQETITQAKSVNVQGKLSSLIRLGERKLTQLLLADQLAKAVFSLDQRAMSEMRAYAHPPEPVYLVAKATLLLLGNHYTDLQDWRQVQVWLGKTGAESLKRRVMAFDYYIVPLEQAHQSKEIYSKFSLAEVRAVSSGAATFYIWGNGMIGLIEQLAAESREKSVI